MQFRILAAQCEYPNTHRIPVTRLLLLRLLCLIDEFLLFTFGCRCT